MLALVSRFAVTEAASKVSVLTCLVTLTLSCGDVWDELNAPEVSVEYWPQISRFRIRFNQFMGVKFDQKYCEAEEAVTALIFACNRLMYASDGLLERHSR